ncbi:MAG: TIGR04290 family methyltransferase [Planctomycetes bacterium]|nr:TIGR04290 family methyltransferase [Planctomycetota bacterium]
MRRTLQSPGNAAAAGVRALGPWFHNLHLPDGTQTAPDHPLGDFPAFKWRDIAPLLPADLQGKRVLDVGCNAGFYSFELARRGAHVLGLDVSDHYLRQAEWARARFGLEDRVRLERRQVYQLAGRPERFDLVLFMGVFYHLRYPLLALDIVARHADDLLVFQSMSLPGDEVVGDTRGLGLDDRGRLSAPGWPRLAFIEHDLAGDPTNWWLPNRACVEALLRDVGFEVIARPHDETYLARRAGRRDDGPLARQRDDELRAACGREAP